MRAGVGYKFFKMRFDLWQVDRNGFPNDLQINARIVMNQNITDTGNFSPGNLRMLITKIVRNMFNGLAHNFEGTDAGIRGHLMFRKGIEIVYGGNKILDHFDLGEDILKVIR